MHVVEVHLTAVQQRKATRGQPFQVSAAAMQKAPNTHLMMKSKPKQSQFARNRRNNKGFRFQAEQYSVVPANTQGGDIAYRGGELVGEIETSGDGHNVRKLTPKSEVTIKRFLAKQNTGGKLVKGSQEAKDRMAAMRAKRNGGYIADDEVEGGKLRLGRKINRAFSRKNVRKAVKATKKGVVDTYRSKEFKAVADIGTDIGLAYAQQQGYVTKDQAKDVRKLKKAAIHEDVPGMKKAAIEGAKNEGERQVRSQMAGGALKEPNAKRKPKGVSNVTMYPNIPKTIKSGNGFRAAGKGIVGSGFLP